MTEPGRVSVRRIVGIATRADDIALGPDHPTVDGMPRIALVVREGVVTSAEWMPGGIHRGAEKLMESRDYRQAIMLADRHDWLSAFCSEMGLAIAAERALGLTPPPRAQVLRILLAEMTRIAHHLCLLAALPGRMPQSRRDRLWAWREEILTLFEEATGQRIHLMISQVGGLREPLEPHWVDRVGELARDPWPQRFTELDNAVSDELAAPGGYVGIAPLSRATALACGASGTVARASGVDLDLRRDDPYLPYPDFDVPVSTSGDAAARVRLLVEEIRVSVRLVAWACSAHADVADGPANVRLPKVVRVPESTTYTWTENPSGINGYLLASANEATPQRLKIRSASFGNAAALGFALAGVQEPDLATAIASFGIICGDVDR